MTYLILQNVERCAGCFACTVACMDQNDIDAEKENLAWRNVFQIEKGKFPQVDITYISLTCLHCTDAPCLLACPTGAIKRDEKTGAVQVIKEACTGCHSCAVACVFGVPRFGPDGKMQKCDLCSARIKDGREPACVRVCPTKALRFGRSNELLLEKEKKSAERIVGAFKCSFYSYEKLK